jgi:hypothetical protein
VTEHGRCKVKSDSIKRLTLSLVDGHRKSDGYGKLASSQREWQAGVTGCKIDARYETSFADCWTREHFDIDEISHEVSYDHSCSVAQPFQSVQISQQYDYGADF